DTSITTTAKTIIPITNHFIRCIKSSLESVTTVESPPVAPAQCERFFAAHPHIKRLATDDTAASVRRVVAGGNPARAAIAGSRAASIYGGTILREHLEDHRENYTRFVLLTAAAAVSEQSDKLSLVLRLAHRP